MARAGGRAEARAGAAPGRVGAPERASKPDRPAFCSATPVVGVSRTAPGWRVQKMPDSRASGGLKGRIRDLAEERHPIVGKNQLNARRRLVTGKLSLTSEGGIP